MSHPDDVRALPRYRSERTRLSAVLEEALSDLETGEVATRRAATRRLRSEAMAELGWFRYPVREWLVVRSARLAQLTTAERDRVVRVELLRTWAFLWEQYVTHPMWAETSADGTAAAVRPALASLVAGLRDVTDAATGEKVAYLAAMLGESTAWDMYAWTLPKRASEMSWFSLAVERYGRTIRDDQGTRLAGVLREIGTTTRNPITRREAEEALVRLSEPR